MNPQGEVIDPAVLDELRAVGPDLLRNVAELFIQDTRARLEEMRALSAANDTQQLQRVAHTLKGSCGAIGAQRTMNICAELEQQLKSGRADQTDELLTRLEAAYREACAVLQRELDAE